MSNSYGNGNDADDNVSKAFINLSLLTLKIKTPKQWRIYIATFWTRPKFFQFHAVFRKILQNRMLVPPPRRVGGPPQGNPGSATEMCVCYEEYLM